MKTRTRLPALQVFLSNLVDFALLTYAALHGVF